MISNFTLTDFLAITRLGSIFICKQRRLKWWCLINISMCVSQWFSFALADTKQVCDKISNHSAQGYYIV